MDSFRRRTLLKRFIDKEKGAQWAVDAFQSTTINELLDKAAINAVGLFQSPICVLLLVKDDCLVAEAAQGLDLDKIETAKIPIGKSYSGRLVKRGEPRLFVDVTHYIKTMPDNLEPYYSNSMISTPLVYNKQIVGLINVCRPAPLTPFSREDLNRLISYGSQTAFAITSQRLVDKRTSELNEAQTALFHANEQLKKDIARRKKAEEDLRESEGRVRAKLDALLLPEGDIGTLELADIFDIPAIQRLMDDFFTVTHFATALLDLQGKVLVATGWQDICTKFHRVHPETAKHCAESDTLLTEGVEPGAFKKYRCKNNMLDIVTPITMDGKHVGNLFLGQFLFEDEPLDYELFRDQARRYGFDEQEYIAAYERVPRWSREKVDAVMSFYRKLAELISKLSHGNIKLVRTLTERDRFMESLRESERRYRNLIENAPDVIYSLAEDGSITSLNPAFERITGWSCSEWLGKPFMTLIHPSDLPLAIESFKQSLGGKKQPPYGLRVLSKSGEYLVGEFTSTPLMEKGKVKGEFGIARDITVRKLAEDGLKQKTDQIISSQKD